MIFLFVITLLLHIGLALWMMVNYDKNRPFSLFFIPLIFILTTIAVRTTDSIVGWPTIQEVPKKFVLHSYVVSGNKEIYLWISKLNSRKPRAHIIPYTKNTHRKLNKIRKALVKGRERIIGEKRSGQKIKKDQFRFYKFNHLKYFSKDRN